MPPRPLSACPRSMREIAASRCYARRVIRPLLASMLLLASCGDPDPATPPDAADDTPDAPPVACTGPRGTHHEQTLSSGGEQRFYFIHVPDDYDCAAGAPLWLDFHGTAGEPRPEEAYGLDAAVAAADREHVIFVRPRSRSSLQGGARIYRWDQNPGDIPRNLSYVEDLVASLEAAYHLDGRILVSGFSSGANMAGHYLDPAQLPVAGIATIGGGFWDVDAATLSRIPAHVYTTTGWRDYMVMYFDQMRELLAANAGPEVWFDRQSDTGHELYGWHFDELLAWLLRGERPPAGVLAAGWTRETVPGDRAILATRPHDTELLAVGSGGAVWRRAAGGTWTALPDLPTPARAHATDLCVNGNVVYASAQLALYRSNNAGTSWIRMPAVPEIGQQNFGTSYLNSVDCGPGRSLLGGGWWTGVESSDGSTWAGAPMIALYHAPAGVAAVTRSAAGTALAVGYYDYVGRRGASGGFTAIALPDAASSWLNASATGGSGRWWVVGDHGSIYASTDDGRHWARQPAPIQHDLYAVAFRDATTGVAAGAHGSAILTIDGGATWTDISTGLDVFFGDVRWVDGGVLVTGERGTALFRAVP